MLKLDERSEGLTHSKRIRLAMFGRSHLGHWTRLGWNGSLPFYAFRYPEHGVVIDYPCGYGRRLVYPFCSEDLGDRVYTPDLEAEALEAVPVQ